MENSFASRLQKAREIAATTLANNAAEAHSIAKTVTETLVARIEENAAKGATHLSATFEISHKELLSYTKLLEISTVEGGIAAFSEELRDNLEGEGTLQFEKGVVSGLYITLTM